MTDSRAIAAYWDHAAEDFDREADHGLHAPATRAAWARRLAGWMPPAPADVLDAGCGTGSLTQLLAEAGHRVTGVDLAPRMTGQARRKLAAAGLSARLLTGDAADPPTGQDRFDALLCRHLLWTLPDPHAALRTWAGLLRPGGRLILVEGRWHPAGQDPPPYTTGAAALPWAGGVTATRLAAAVRPLTAGLRIEDLTGEPSLWGGPVNDQRYALIARTPHTRNTRNT
ncbi:class I SAM-dependent methyltransferase [Streptomyces klenkii]|uniref:Class I SAM-dependent methyltransferase n=1 Tax=Streptomyces klenkii TaxID=1420899 RepID=A0A3B0A3Z5_9ACTN|nr:class I SAM-dependent methyltransferase [Streptomyces klenkii]RKN55074.1 class I SAM-dependent methyltransferase [Streptomyces klenkii]